MHQALITAIADIDQCLPQTQCTMCGYPSCLDYAGALARQETQLNRCPPGGETTRQALAEQLSTRILPPALDCEPYPGRKTAQIIEHDCIGCTLCIEPCPVDAIVGAARQMHSVLVEECTGCGLCVSLCPVDCIEMVDLVPAQRGERWPEFLDREVSHWRQLAERHRLQRARRTESKSDASAREEDVSEIIRGAVNRERERRWKASKRVKRTSAAPQTKA